jgi:hypothetical protein
VGDAGRRSANLAVGEPVIFDAGKVDRRQLLHRGAGLRALDGELRVAVAREIDYGIEAVVGADVLEILVLVGGVDAEEVVVVGNLVDQDVVDEAAVVVEQAGVVGLSGFQFGDRVGRHVIREPAGFGAADLDFAHMADVEDAGRGTHCVVLFDDAGVLDGHVPASEIDHLGAQRAMDGIQRCGAERRCCGHENSG